MSRRNLTRLVLLILAFAVVQSPRTLFAQYANPEGEMIRPQTITVPFPFRVGDKLAPAGKYDIDQPSRETLTLRSEKGQVFDVQVITRLAKPPSPLTESRVVFDKFGDTYSISEIWIPNADGFFVGATRAVHTHEVVPAAMKK